MHEIAPHGEGGCNAMAALVLGVTVLLSVVFWMPSFSQRGRRAEWLDPSAGFEGERVCIAGSQFSFDSVSCACVNARRVVVVCLFVFTSLCWIGECSMSAALDLDAQLMQVYGRPDCLTQARS